MKKILLFLFAVITSITTFASESPVYAKVINVSSSLNIREQPNKQSRIVGKIENNETVQILSISKDGWTNIQYGELTGYVKSSFLQEIKQETIEEKKNFLSGIIEWCEDYKFYILFVLSIFVFVWTRMPEDDFGITMLKLVSYSILLTVGFIFAGRDAYLEKDLDCWIENDHWIKHAFNVVMLSFYMFTLINGFICTGDSLAKLGTKNLEDYKAVSVSFFLWLVPLLLVSALIGSITAGIPVVIVIGLAFWKFFKNCKLMWPKLQYPFLIAILGLAACIAIAYVFYNLISNIILLLIYGALFVGILKSAPKTLSEAATTDSTSADSSIQSATQEQDPYYDTIIEGAGSFGGDVKGKRHWNGEIEGENGKWYKEELNGRVTEKE